MRKSLLIERDRHQTRIAVLEDGKAAEVYFESRGAASPVGSVYKGRVTRVLPGMQAAFVDLGLARDAFLYAGDAQAGNGEPLEAVDENGSEGVRALRPIEEVARVGQELLVQVRKEPRAGKGARVTTQIGLPGRFLVLFPGSHHLGVSRRIEEGEERERLRGLLDDLRPDDAGLIARTEAAGRRREDLAGDLEVLEPLWRELEERGRSARAPALVHREADLVGRTVRDVFGEDFAELRLEGPGLEDEILAWLDRVRPELRERVHCDREGRLFDRFGVSKAIEAALESRVWLRSGGYLVIQPTEALVAIDVNTGRFVGRHSLEDTIFRTNMEAVAEIVRQIRLRDLGGILVIDFIDMEEEHHRAAVLAALEQELQRDRARTRVASISEFGLVELTRKRSRSNLRALLTEACPCCSGSGRVRSLASICVDLRREVVRRLASCGEARRPLRLSLHPDVARALEKEQHAILEEIEELCGSEVVLQPDAGRRRESFDVVPL